MVSTPLMRLACVVLAFRFGAVESLRKRRTASPKRVLGAVESFAHVEKPQEVPWQTLLMRAQPGPMAAASPEDRDAAPHAPPERFAAEAHLVNQQRRTWPGEHGTIRTGLALSGGGARSLSWCSGALRALTNLGLMDKIEAVSSVSGGTWTSSVFMFQKKYHETELLGAPSNFSELTLEELSKPIFKLNDVVSQSTNARLVWFAARYPFDQVWERMMQHFILRPFELGDMNTFIAANESHVADIIRRNPKLHFGDFLWPHPSRPKVFIMNGIMTCPKYYGVVWEDSPPFQMSPDFTGIPHWPKYNQERGEPESIKYEGTWGVNSDVEIVAGGGLLETFAFGGASPSSQNTDGQITVDRPERSMSLTTATAISSGPISMPQRYAWPFLPEGQTQEAVKYSFADAGIVENTGLLALLQRKVRRAVSVVSGNQITDLTIDFCNPGGRNESEWEEIFTSGKHTPEQVTSMFGYRFRNLMKDRKHVHVFPKDRALPLMCRFQELKKAGKPSVLAETLPVLENQWHGIEGGFDVKVVFIVLDVSTDFEKSLPESMQKELEENSMFSAHPAYSTFEHLDTMYLKRPISNLLAAQAEYSVRVNEELFREVLG